MWGGGGSSSEVDRNKRGEESPTIAQFAAAEMRTQKRLAEMQDALNLILLRLPETLGPSQGLPQGPGTPVSTTRSVGFKNLSPEPGKPLSTGRSFAEPSSSVPEDEDPASRIRRHGTLTVHIVRAKDLIKADVMGLSDPYVQISLAGQPKKRCATIKKNLNPEWDEKIDFEGVLEHFVSEDLVLEVFDQDFGMLDAFRSKSKNKEVNTDDKLGRVGLDLKQLMNENHVEFEDRTLEGVKTGTITCSVSWIADSNVDANSVRALVERDPEVRALLRDVRRAMDAHTDKTNRLDQKKHAGASAKAAAAAAARTSVRTSKGAAAARDVKFVPPANDVPRGMRRTNSQSSISSDSSDSKPEPRWTGRKLCRFFCGPVLDPNSRFRTIWNVCLAAFIVYCGVSVPFEIAFEQDMVDSMCGTGLERRLRAECPSFQWWFWLNFCVDMWFISDIVINMRTGYVKEGHFVSDDWLAAKNYLQGSFFMDCLGSFPLNLIMMVATPDNPYGDVLDDASGADAGGNAARANRLLRLLRLAKLAKLARMAKLGKYLANFEEFLNPGVLAVIQLSIIGLMCCHWFGCLWWLVSDLELQEPALDSRWYTGEVNTWHPAPWLKNEESLWAKYMYSFFWGAGMVTSMTPFDIMPVTPFEAFVTTLTMFVGLLLNAFVISSLTTALATMNSKKELAGKQLDTIRNYLLLKGVPTDLRSRILEYYEYLFTSSQSLASSVKMDEMPPNLSAQLVIAMYRKLAAKCTVFKEISEPCLITLMQALVPCVFVPGQLLVFEGHSLQNVYFINRGHIQLLERTVHVQLLRDNDNFGVDDFMSAYLTKATPIVKHTAKAVTYCDVMSLSYHQLLEAVDKDEKFQAVIKSGGLRPKESEGRGKLAIFKKRTSQGGKNLEQMARSTMEHEDDELPAGEGSTGSFAKKPPSDDRESFRAQAALMA